ncbi:MAG: aryl-sulfate sulfotransferase, partial [Candidatus Hodarchaeales archaeon]
MEGNLVNEALVNEEQGYGYGTPINSTTHLLYSNYDNIYFWDIYSNTLTPYPIDSHHDISYNPKTGTFITLQTQKITFFEDTYKFDIISEVNSTGSVIWQLDTSTIIPWDLWDANDVTHGNTVFWDMEEDTIYFNSRNLNTFYKIDRKTRTVIWSLGKHGDFKLFDRS